MAYDCLETLIGITESTCDCTIDGMTNDDLTGTWYKDSTSGLFIDQLEGIVPLQSVGASTECANEMATFYSKARDNAIKTMADEVMIGLTKRAVNGKKKYVGLIGGKSYGSAFDLNGFNYAGLKLYTYAMKGGVITINKIYTMMDATATFDIIVYKLEHGATELELVTTIEDIESEANVVKTNTLTTPVTIDLSMYGAEFYFLYVPNSFNPKRNTLSCGCGSKEHVLNSYMVKYGVTTATVEGTPLFSTYPHALGIAFDAEVGCDTTSIICASYDEDEAVKLVMAYAARFKAGELIHEFILKSDNINRYTMSSRESLYGKRNHFKAEYNTRINWLIENLNLNLIDCYICNDKRINKGGILV